MPIVEYLPNINHYLPFSAAVTSGDLVFLSGEIGVSPGGHLAGDLIEQTRQALCNIEATLRRMSCSRLNIVRSTLMLTDMNRWDDVNAEYRKFFDGRELPARSAFGVLSLALGAAIEIECIAVL